MKLSVITPSFNQGRFIQAAIDSVLSQGYPDLEYIVMDGGSTDMTVPILRTYKDRIIWTSEKDKGQADAVNKGILRAEGEVIGWLNSDDFYYPEAFRTVMGYFKNHPEANVVYGHADYVNEDGSYQADYFTEPWDYERLSELCYISQPSVFFRRETVIKHGLLDLEKGFVLDYELWMRMGKHETFHFINKKLSATRMYADTKTSGSRKKAAAEVLPIIQKYYGEVNDRAVSDYAHAMLLEVGEPHPDPNDTRLRSEFISGLITHSTNAILKYRGKIPDALADYPYTIKPLRIGFDISAVTDKMAGVEQYTVTLLETMTRIDPNNDYILYPIFGRRITEQYGLVKKEYPGCIKLFGDTTREQARGIFSGGVPDISRELGYPNVVHSTAFEFVKNHNAANVYTLYDLSFFETVEFSTYANRYECFSGMLEASMAADIFISISNYTKQVFLKYFPYVEADRIHVIPLSYRESLHAPVDVGNELRSLGIGHKNPFWLTVGTVEPRKNINALVRAYLKLRDKTETYPLYLVGKKGWLDDRIHDEIKAANVGDDIRILGYVNESQLSALYQSCYAMVYPSLYEGFGLPILEAMSLGAPVISSNTTSMPEVGGDAVLYVDPNNVSDIFNKMKTLQENRVLRDTLSEKGRARALSEFSWEKTAAKTIICYYEAVWRHNRAAENESL